MSAAALMLSETSPRSCVLPLCISHCWRPSLSGQSSVSSETSVSLLECPRGNPSPGQGARDVQRPSSITLPSPFLKFKAVSPVSIKQALGGHRMLLAYANVSPICFCGPLQKHSGPHSIKYRSTVLKRFKCVTLEDHPLCSYDNRAGKLQLQRRGSLGRTDTRGLNGNVCPHTAALGSGASRN